MSDRPLRLMLIDDDPIFRLGLRFWLNQFVDLTVIAESETGTNALEQLQTLQTQDLAVEGEEPPLPRVETLNLVILSLSLGQADPAQMPALTLCQTIRQRYPQLPVLLLSSLAEPLMLAAAQQAGASGFCLKSVNTTMLGQAIRQVATGESYWQAGLAIEPLTSASLGAIAPNPTASTSPSPSVNVPSPLAILRRNLRNQGLRQIDGAIADLTRQLQTLDLSLLDRAILAGRYRELRASRWLVQRLLATPTPSSTDPIVPEPTPTPAPPTTAQLPVASSALAPIKTDSTALLNTVIDAHRLQAMLFDSVLAKIQTSLQNQTNVPLEIDILREDKKRELFYLILRKFENLLNELRYSQVQVDQLAEKRSPILLDLWQDVTTDFVGRYYTIILKNQPVEVLPSLLQTAVTVETEILNKIPGVTELVAHLLFQTPLSVNGTSYAAGNPEALVQAEILFEHLLIQVANAVMQAVLNQFPNVEKIKHDFYDRQLMSSRDIERFRNNLSWRYRLDRVVLEPKDIFESQHRVFVFQARGIKQTEIYAPRTQELDDLSGVQLLVTLALETRDAIAPRLRAAISIVGSGLVYVLTEVVGRGIGLIGRGVLKGVGYWQEGDRRRARR